MAVMPLGEHLEELRRRLIICLVAVGAAFVLCWKFRHRIWLIVQRPHVLAMQALDLDTLLKYSSHFESFIAQIKTCMAFGLVLVSPVVIYQLWAFIAPGLFPHERRRGVRLAAACLLCLAAGVGFGYFVFLPVALRYLISLSGGWAEPVLMIGSYLSLVFTLTVALAIVFQTPVIIFYLIRWGVLEPAALQRCRKGFVLTAFIVGAILTPPDLVTQLMMAVTLIVLYDLGGLAAAPSRTAFRGFLGFTGAILLAGAVALAWFHLWPVGELAAVRGEVRMNDAVLAAGTAVRLRRGAVCRTGPQGLAEIAPADGEARIHLAPGGRLQVHGATGVSLYAGRCLVRCPGGGPAVSVRTAPARAELAGGRAEFHSPDPDTLTVTVFEGTAHVSAGGQDLRVAAGRTATFRSGGEPADLAAADSEWRTLLAPADPP